MENHSWHLKRLPYATIFTILSYFLQIYCKNPALECPHQISALFNLRQEKIYDYYNKHINESSEWAFAQKYDK